MKFYTFENSGCTEDLTRAVNGPCSIEDVISRFANLPLHERNKRCVDFATFVCEKYEDYEDHGIDEGVLWFQFRGYAHTLRQFSYDPRSLQVR